MVCAGGLHPAKKETEAREGHRMSLEKQKEKKKEGAEKNTQIMLLCSPSGTQTPGSPERERRVAFWNAFLRRR